MTARADIPAGGPAPGARATGETTLRIPELVTERLRLRAPCMADFEAYAAYSASERARWVGGPFTRAEAFDRLASVFGHWALRGYGRWIVADRESDAPLGLVGPFYPEGWLEPEIAWTVFNEAEGRGVAFEAAIAARAHAYATLGWTTSVSLIDADNRRSIALAERLGATREGVFRHETLGPLEVWRHPGPAALGIAGAA